MRVVTFTTKFWGPWVMERVGAKWFDGMGVAFGSIDLDERKPLGGVAYDLYAGNSIHIHIAADDHRWLTKEVLWCGFDYPFNQLEVKKLIAPVRSSNTRALGMTVKFGFKEETRIKDFHLDGEDLIFMVTTKDKAQRWLDLESRINPEHLVQAA